jgi:hypothetical protein
VIKLRSVPSVSYALVGVLNMFAKRVTQARFVKVAIWRAGFGVSLIQEQQIEFALNVHNNSSRFSGRP